MSSVDILYVGGPTAVIGSGGVRLLTDPAPDPPGEYPIGSRSLVKTAGPAVPATEITPVDGARQAASAACSSVG